MTVGELIKALADYPRGMTVRVETATNSEVEGTQQARYSGSQVLFLMLGPGDEG